MSGRATRPKALPAMASKLGTPNPVPCVRSRSADQAVLTVSVVPSAKRTEVVGLHDGDLRVRLAAPPVDGKANDMLTAWVAEQLNLPKRAVRVLRGQTSRQKQLEIDAPATQVQAWVAHTLATQPKNSSYPDAARVGGGVGKPI
jgi:hypothetical protein